MGWHSLPQHLSALYCVECTCNVELTDETAGDQRVQPSTCARRALSSQLVTPAGTPGAAAGTTGGAAGTAGAAAGTPGTAAGTPGVISLSTCAAVAGAAMAGHFAV